MTTKKTFSRAMRGAVLAFALVLACSMCCVIQTQPVSAAGNFIIEDFDIDMQVNEDDTYLITETVKVHFTVPSHGIYVVIPYKTTLDRDGQVDTFYAKVRDFEMLSGQPVKKQKTDEICYFKIGNKKEYAATDTTYKYSYVFDMRGDHLKGADEVYYNLVGTRWEAQSINHISFRVTFPKDIDMTKVGIKTGYFAGYETYIPFETEGNRVVKGETTENVKSGLTIRAVLPEGYFTKQAGSSNLLFFLLMAALAAATLVGFVLWRKYGRDPHIVETEEFYPPKGLSAPEVAYLENGEVTGSQITSMLLTLADKGFLKITENEELVGLRKNKRKVEYEITKLKSVDDADASTDEKAFMNGLFKDGSDTVEVSELKNSFYKTVEKIKKNIERRYKDKLYDKKADSCASTTRFIGIVGMVALFVVFKLLNGSPFFVGLDDFMIYLVYTVLALLLPLSGFYGIAAWINRPRKRVVSFIFGLIGWCILIGIGFGLALLLDVCMGGQIVLYLIGMGMIFLLFLMAALCEKKTDYYADLLGKIRGYKRFLKVAEKDRMEALAESDPDYFYKNLAFAFALGVTSVYAKNFAALANQPPDWYVPAHYSAGSAFNSSSLMDSMDSMMSTTSSTMTSSPSSSGGGGGGSFSGGGGAGGSGGGSW